MKNINFDKIFKLALLILFALYIIVNILNYKMTMSIKDNGRYTGVRAGEDLLLILDTKTGKIKNFSFGIPKIDVDDSLENNSDR